jgi:MFS family permease
MVVVLFMSLLQAFTGTIADKLNKRALVISGSLINVIFLILIPTATSFKQLLALCALGGIGGALSMPAASALNVEEGRKFGMGSTLGVFAMAFSIGMATGPLLGGFMADSFNLNSAFYLGAGAGLIGTVLLVWFTRHEHQTT